MSGEPITEQPQAGADAPPPAPSLDDTLAAEIDKLYDASERHDAASDKAQTQERGPDGKFAAPPGSKENTESTDQPTTETPGTAPPSIEPPVSWSADVKAKWAALPPDLQAFIAKRESESHERITTDGQRLKGYESLERVLAPRRAALAQSFGSEAAAVEQLFALSDMAGRDFPGFVRMLAQQRGVDLRTLVDPPAGQPADPHIATLNATVQKLESKLSAREVAEQEAQARQIAATIGEFQGRKTSDGKPQYPHFERVRESMGRLMDSGAATSLEQAYTKAVRLDDELWQQDQKAKEAEQKAAAEAEAKRKAEEARKGSRSDPRSKSGSPGAAKLTLDDTINALLDQRGVA